MSGTEAATAVLLAITVLAAVLSTVGLLLANDFYERLQYMNPIATVGAAALAAAVLLNEGLSQAGIKIVLIALALYVSNAVLTHATARAGRVARYGNLKLRPEEKANRAGQEKRRDAA